jgi:putative SOS response-associated peptidase YedK
MCGRFVSVSSPQSLVERFGVEETALEQREPDYNVTPRALVPIVRDRPARPERELPAARVLSMVRWGLVPSWAESTAIGDKLINARAETVTDKAAYKRAFLRRRCIVPADAFYEWRPSKRSSVSRPPRQPYLVRRRDGAPLAFAGLWEVWRDETVAERDAPDGWLRSCTIVTTRANTVLEPIHHRMPVVLDECRWDEWLDPANDDVGALGAMLEPAPDEWFDVFPVSARVNTPDNNDADLVRRVPADTLL